MSDPTLDARLAAADNQFGFDLFVKLQQQDKDKNIFFSPLSVAFALAMTYNGAVGVTKDEMARVLKLQGMNHAELNQASEALLKTLKSADPKIKLAIANSLWSRMDMKFEENFLARNRQYFGAEISPLNFSDPKAVDVINNWVSQSTEGKIPRLLDRISEQQVLFLINAIYFKGQWTKKFEIANTKDQPFHLLAGKQKAMPMMAQSGDYEYFRGDKFQAVALPYGKGGVSLYLFLPDQDLSPADFLKRFSYGNWEQWVKSFAQTPGDLKIPRFKLDYESGLNDPLKALGMTSAFTAGKADFSGMRSQRDLFISEVKHKAIVEVNEEGSEAAAATSVGMSLTSMRPPQKRFNFVADRPFVMVIRDQQTGAILFMGSVIEPK